MTNPFEDQDAVYLVLANPEGQHSLWPAAVTVPAGWTVLHGPAGRTECVDFVNANWTDMRPRSLAALMDRE